MLNYGGSPNNQQYPEPMEEENWDEKFGQALTQNFPNLQPNQGTPSSKESQEQGEGENGSNVPEEKNAEISHEPAKVRAPHSNNVEVSPIDVDSIILEEEVNKEVPELTGRMQNLGVTPHPAKIQYLYREVFCSFIQ